MKRLRGWEQALTRLHMSRMQTPYEWSMHDCCIFAADSVLAVTGEDFAVGYRGQYSTRDEAYALLASLGHRHLGDLASAMLPEILTPEGQPAPMLAQRGDVVLGLGEAGDFLAICDGVSAVGPGFPRGISHVPLTIARRAWRVG